MSGDISMPTRISSVLHCSASESSVTATLAPAAAEIGGGGGVDVATAAVGVTEDPAGENGELDTDRALGSEGLVPAREIGETDTDGYGYAPPAPHRTPMLKSMISPSTTQTYPTAQCCSQIPSPKPKRLTFSNPTTPQPKLM
jgi:hypothetical protein